MEHRIDIETASIFIPERLYRALHRPSQTSDKSARWATII